MEEVPGQQPHFMNGAGTDPKDAARFVEALRHDQDDLVETVQYRKDGSRFVATVLLSAFKDDDGNTIHHFLSRLDVTRRAEAEGEVIELRDQQSALRAAEQRSRESEAHQGFVLRLSDALRPLYEAEAVTEVATRLLAEKVGADRAYFVQWPLGKDYGEVGRDYAASGLASLAGRYPIETFRSTYDRIANGQTWAVSNAASDAEIADPERAYYLDNGVVAWVDVPLLKNGEVHAALCMVQAAPRDWTALEIAMAEEAAERCWDAIGRARAESALRESEQKYRSLFETMGQGYCEFELVRDADGEAVDQRYLKLNPAFERIFGVTVPEAEGRLASEVFPALDKWWHETFDRIAKNGVPERVEHEISAFDRWFEVTAYPSGPDHLTALFEDITMRKKAEFALRDSEARLQAAFESVPAGLAVIDLNGRAVLANSEFRRFLPNGVVPARDPERADRWQAWSEEGQLLDPQDWPSARALRGESVVPGQEMLFTADDGREIWTNVATAPTFDDAGRVTGVVSVISDIDERKRAETALRHSETELADELAHAALLRDLALKLVTEESLPAIYGEILDAAIAITEADTGTVQIYDPSKKALVLLVTRGIEQSMADHFLSVDASSCTACGIALRTGERTFVDFDTDNKHLIDESCRLHVESGLRSAQATPLLSRSGEPLGMLNTHWAKSQHRPTDRQLRSLDLLARQAADLIERRRAEMNLRDSERHATILLAELQHGVRNTLGVVRSIARRTAENSDSVDDMLGHFPGRLDAFSRVQAALTRSAGATVDLTSLIEKEMVAHAAKEGEQVSIGGPDIDLDPRTAERLSLAIHELTTNAVKHGAFVTSHGKVKIRWTTEAGDGADVLTLSWRESGVTIDPSESQQDGLGMELLQRSLPYDLGGETSVEFRPSGLNFELRLPLNGRRRDS